MSSTPSYREILEILYRNKLDLHQFRDEIIEKYESMSEGFNFPEMETFYNKSIVFISGISNSCTVLIDFWQNLQNLTGGLKSQDLIDKIRNIEKRFPEQLKSMGLFFLRAKQAKPYIASSRIHAVKGESWINLLDLLQSDEKFLESARFMQKIRKKYSDLRISEELTKMFSANPDLSEEDRSEFIDAFKRTHISLEEFLRRKYPHQEPAEKKHIPSEDLTLENDEFDDYRLYLEADERELARMKRTGTYSVRKKGKKRSRREKS